MFAQSKTPMPPRTGRENLTEIECDQSDLHPQKHDRMLRPKIGNPLTHVGCRRRIFTRNDAMTFSKRLDFFDPSGFPRS
jgi:hypothetical protein